ncbi:uncharacterized protein DUF2785 [Fontibacillus phaseoli]|uniref:Uncharacterized protein DUF2785 n=1 Tax=Fontibacillus phaseoli TaxID=1416533 RepID=A0A369BQN2_9BACL|nr:DUF2785 domain-containing protein [Fontibacillus phaseoli]RCX23863.1 uncharacterized protein DUF2785 [Fontibacillus phaseoli]
MNLKQQLQEISENEYKIPEGISIDTLVCEMMSSIGSVDSELRDSLIYMTLYYWTIRNEISPEIMKEMLYTCLDEDHLFLGLGENESDTVFTRAFSVLVVPLALTCNTQINFLTEEDIQYTFDKITTYFHQEKDFRGYVEDKGWAHAVAHASDALESIVNSSYVRADGLLTVLELILEKTHVSNPYYIHLEDERMTNVIVTIINRNVLSDEQLMNWIRRVGTYPETGIISDDFNRKGNARNLLRSVYFKLIDQQKEGLLLSEIITVLNKM